MDDPSRVYKFCSLWIELSQNVFKVERSTYSMLEWLGDVGGLYDGLILIFGSVIGSLSSFQLK